MTAKPVLAVLPKISGVKRNVAPMKKATKRIYVMKAIEGRYKSGALTSWLGGR
jgi:hypothetical protein